MKRSVCSILAVLLVAGAHERITPALADEGPCFKCTSQTPGSKLDVWIDAGHDTVHIGNIGMNPDAKHITLPLEWQVTWPIAQKLRQRLLQYFYCTGLIRTLRDTKYLPGARGRIANGWCVNDANQLRSAKLLVSIHTNADPNRTVLGTETMVAGTKQCTPTIYGPYQDEQFAALFHPTMMDHIPIAYTGLQTCSDDRGVIASRFNGYGEKTMIEVTTMPTILVEVGFQTNQCQASHLNDNAKQGLIADAIYYGISGSGLTASGCFSGADRPPVVASAVTQEPVAATGTPVVHRVVGRARVAGRATTSEGFEGGAFPPTGWSVQTSGAPSQYAWSRTTAVAYVPTGSGAAFIGGGWQTAKTELLVSPATALAAGDNALQFTWFGNANKSDSLDVQLLARPVGSGTWATLWSLSSQEFNEAWLMQSSVVSLQPYAGQTIEYAFRSVGTSGADFAVDDVAIGSFSVPQAPGNDLCASATQILRGNSTISGSTRYAHNDMDPGDLGCVTGYPMDGRDVFYRLNVLAGDTLTASVDGDFSAGLYLTQSCSAGAPGCVNGTYYEDGYVNPSVSDSFATAGTYYLVVDAPQGSRGDFELTVHTGGAATSSVGSGEASKSLLRVSPNPMKSEAQINYYLAQPARHLQLAVYDIAGHLLTVVEDGPRSGGAHSTTWSGVVKGGGRAQAGVYFVRLSVDGAVVQNQRVTLVH